MDVPTRGWAKYEVIYTDRNKRKEHVIEIIKMIREEQENEVYREALSPALIDSILQRLQENKKFDVQPFRICVDGY